MTILAQVNNRPGIILMTALFSVITILVTVLRFTARRLTKAATGVDDWLAFASLVRTVHGDPPMLRPFSLMAC